MKKVFGLFAMVVLVSGMAVASPSFLGTSGSILTPDASILPAAGFSANYNGMSLDGATPNSIGASVGINGGLELGLTRLDPDFVNSDIETLVNVKYLALAETASRPSLVFGAVDLTGAVDPNGDGGFYALIGKNLTSLATNMVGRPSMPLNGYVGFGTGIYDGLFAGVSWELSPKIKLMGEFISEISLDNVMNKDSMFNAGAAFAFNESLSGNLSLLDGEDLGYGLSYSAEF